MAILENTTKAERNKIIAAIVLGILAIISLFLAFGGSITGRSQPLTKPTPTPTRTPNTAARQTDPNNVRMPEQETQDLISQTTPIVYQPGSFDAPDPGRNIFAFYEPPPPCRPGIDCPTPTPTPLPIITPTPTPEIFVTFLSPQTTYAGSKGFRLQVAGERFDPSSRIYFGQSELPTTFLNPQMLTADVPANFIANEGPRQIIVRTPDGRKHSNQMMFSVQAPPKPNFQYIGMIARKLANNDTAYFMEPGKQTPTAARLNDILGNNRFRVVSIAADQAILQDVNLGFRHSLPIQQPPAGTPVVGAGPPGRGGAAPGGYVPYAPNIPNINELPAGSIPGIPDGIPRATPRRPANSAPEEKKDNDSDEDGNNQ
jgi:hypothetical protein